ncbi:PAS domain S-box protein [Mucilaginibacter gynuensis]
MKSGALRIAVIYIIISLIWITCSDKLLFYFFQQLSENQLLLIGSVKGCFFVSGTGLALYLLINSNEKKLSNSEAQYRSMYEANPEPMWIYDEATLKILSVNDAAIAAYGYSRAEFLSKSILDIRPAQDVEKVKEATKKVQAEPNKSGKWRHLKKDGSLITVIIISHKIRFNEHAAVVVMARDITERVTFQDALQKVNQDLQAERTKLRETQRISRVGGWEFYPENNNLVWSAEVYEITGISADDTRPAFDIYIKHIHPEDRPQMVAGLQSLLKEGRHLDVTHRIIGLDGEIRYIRQLAKLETSPEAGPKIIGSMQDITEIKQLEEERNKYFYSLENTLNSMSDAFFALDAKMDIIRCNQVFLSIIGKPGEEVIGMNIFNVFPRERNKLYPAYEKALHEKVIVKLDEYSTNLEKWIRLAAYPTDEGVAVYFSDITEHKLKDSQLKEAIERYELVAQATRDVIYDLDMVNNQLVYNTSLTQLVKIPIDQVGYDLQWWRSLIHQDDVANVAASQHKISSEGKTNWECEYRIDIGGGEYKYVMDQGYFVYNDQKEPVRLIGAIRDIDELKRSINENKRLADLITRVNNMIIVTDCQNRVEWVNRAFEENTGFKLPEIAGKTPFEFLTGPSMAPETVEKLLTHIKAHEAFVLDLIIYTIDNIPVWVAAEFTPSFNSKGEYQGYIAVYQNINSRKEKEDEVKRQNEFLREVAWMSSHEIRRPVATILGLMNLTETAGTIEEKDEMLGLIGQTAREMDTIVHSINEKIAAAVHYNK